MKHGQRALLAVGLVVLGGWGFPLGQPAGGAGQTQVKIRAGTFTSEDTGMVIIIKAAKNGVSTVSGHMGSGPGKRIIEGNISQTGALRASLSVSGTAGKTVPMNGRYRAKDDTIFIHTIDGEPAGILLARMGGKGVQEGDYSAMERNPDVNWEVSITKSSGPDFNLVGTLEVNGKKSEIAGTLKEDGRITGRAGAEGSLVLTGAYDFEHETIKLIASAHPGAAGLTAILKPGKLSVGRNFGLVSKVVGNVPGPAEAAEYTVSGEVSENSFSLTIKMKPPYQGEASIKHEFSSPLGSTLRPGDIIELTVISSADKSGRDAPRLAGTGYWRVEGDGAEVLNEGKQFIGTASNGQFYASGQAVTKFKVLSKGTIKITAGYAGQYWGPSGNFNWDPCTYTYKFGEVPAKSGG